MAEGELPLTSLSSTEKHAVPEPSSVGNILEPGASGEGELPLATGRDMEDIDFKIRVWRELGLSSASDKPTTYMKHIETTAKREGYLKGSAYFQTFADMIAFFKDAPTSKTPSKSTTKRSSISLGKAVVRRRHTIHEFIEQTIREVKKREKNRLRPGDESHLVESVTDDVFCMLGVWLTMESYFYKRGGRRAIEKVSADCPFPKTAAECTLTELLMRCPGIPYSYKREPPSFLREESQRSSLRISISNASGSDDNEEIEAPFSTESCDCAFDPGLDLEESGQVEVKRLNLYTLKSYAGVEIHWTKNIARHLLLSHRYGRYAVEVFCLPSSLFAKHPSAIDNAFIQEVKSSYASLFNIASEPARYRGHRRNGSADIATEKAPHVPDISSPHREIFSRLCFRHLWCSCRRCQCRRVAIVALRSLKKEMCCYHDTLSPDTNSSDTVDDLFDPMVLYCISRGGGNWTREKFPILWGRIMKLWELQETAKPWNLSALFRDRRDTVSWWGMIFVVVIIPLTLLQVFLGVAQTVASFKQIKG